MLEHQYTNSTSLNSLTINTPTKSTTIALQSYHHYYLIYTILYITISLKRLNYLPLNHHHYTIVTDTNSTTTSTHLYNYPCQLNSVQYQNHLTATPTATTLPLYHPYKHHSNPPSHHHYTATIPDLQPPHHYTTTTTLPLSSPTTTPPLHYHHYTTTIPTLQTPL